MPGVQQQGAADESIRQCDSFAELVELGDGEERDRESERLYLIRAKMRSSEKSGAGAEDVHVPSFSHPTLSGIACPSSEFPAAPSSVGNRIVPPSF